MSDISLPPEPPTDQKKYFIDKPAVKGLLTLACLAAPLPVLLSLLELWLGFIAAPEWKEYSAVAIFRQLFDASGNPPLWLVPVAFIPSAVLLVLLYKKSSPALLLVLFLLLLAAGGETLVFQQMINS